MTAEGLTSVLKNDSRTNYISVCDEKCDLIESESTSSVAKCKLPGLSTIYSNSNFSIAEESDNLKAASYWGKASDYMNAFDDKLLTPPEDRYDPFLGMAFKEGHVGAISQVKYFI